MTIMQEICRKLEGRPPIHIIELEKITYKVDSKNIKERETRIYKCLYPDLNKNVPEECNSCYLYHPQK